MPAKKTPTLQSHRETQTCDALVHQIHSNTQTGNTPSQATSTTVAVVYGEVEGNKVMPFVTPSKLDNLGYHEYGRESQIDPMMGKNSKSTQTPTPENATKMTKVRRRNRRVSAVKRQLPQKLNYQGTHTHTHTHTHTLSKK